MSYGRDLTGDIMRMFAVPDEPDWIEVEPVDELAIEAAMDYCETCGKFTDGETCVACGDAEAWVCDACGRSFPTERTAVGHLDMRPRSDGYHMCHGTVHRTPENRSGNPA
jgi:hypothetical protein